MKALAATGANLILMIIDTCYAGNAFDALVQVNNHFRASPPARERSWFGMLVACGPEAVRQRLLGPALSASCVTDHAVMASTLRTFGGGGRCINV